MSETTAAPTSVAATLRAAKALIDTPEKWTRHTEASRTKRGFGVNARDPKAALFCMMGALIHVDGPYEDAAIETLAMAVGGSGYITDFNDARGRKHADVMAAYDKAIALAESES